MSQTLTPTSDSSPLNWGSVPGGTAHYATINDDPASPDTSSYILATAANVTDRIGFGTLTLAATSVVLSAYTAAAGALQISARISVDGGATWTASQTFGSGSGALRTLTFTVSGSVGGAVYVEFVAGSTFTGTPAFVYAARGVATAPASTVTITSPAGGEVWPQGSSHAITGTSTYSGGIIRLDYSTDGGATWRYIAKIANASSWSYTWTVPAVTGYSSMVRARHFTTDAVGYWPMDEGSGSSTADLSATGANGSLIGPPAWVNNSPAVGGGLQFTTGEYVQTVDAPAFRFLYNTPFTLVSRFKATNLGSLDILLAKEANSVNFQGYYVALDSGVVNLLCQSSQTNYAWVKGSTQVGDSVERWVICTYDGSGSASGLHIYVNGLADALTTRGDNLGTGDMSNSSPLNFGARQGGGLKLDGSIYEVRVYSRVLSSGERAAIVGDSETADITVNSSAFSIPGPTVLLMRGRAVTYNARTRQSRGAFRLGYADQALHLRGLGIVRGVSELVSRGLAGVRRATSLLERGRAANTVPSKQQFRGAYAILNLYPLKLRGVYGCAVGRSLSLRGRTRVANTGFDRYELYIGTDGPPDFTAAPAATGTALPFVSSALAAGHTYHCVVRHRNQWGLVSQNAGETVFAIDGSGNLIVTPPSPPTQITATAGAGGTIVVTASYAYRADGANQGDGWLVYLRSDGTNPNPATDTPAVVSMGKADGTARLLYTSTAYANGTTVKALVRVRRSGTPNVDSTNTAPVTAVAGTTGPAAVTPADAFLGYTAEQGQ